MPTIKETAYRFFDACEAGKGWDACREFCHDNATFAAQVGKIWNDTHSLKQLGWA